VSLPVIPRNSLVIILVIPSEVEGSALHPAEECRSFDSLTLAQGDKGRMLRTERRWDEPLT
jgi:hypothetical protein